MYDQSLNSGGDVTYMFCIFSLCISPERQEKIGGSVWLSLLRWKNQKAKSLQFIYVGLYPSSVHGYLLCSPERNELLVNTHVVFHELHTYGGRYSDQMVFDNVHRHAIPVETLVNIST